MAENPPGSLPSEQEADSSEKRSPQQFKALFLKNLKLQSKQMGTNVCQILTPILCILFTYLMITVSKDNIPVGSVYEPNYYPIKFGNFSFFDDRNPNLRQPVQWAVYECIEKCDKTYLGENNGSKEKIGLLGKVSQTVKQAVPFIVNPFENLNLTESKTVPFFVQTNYSTINKDLFHRLSVMDDKFSFIANKSNRPKALTYFPDGAYSFIETSDQQLRLIVRVNDVREMMFHSINGITMIQELKQKIGDAGKKPGLAESTVPTGFLGVMDFPLSAYISKVSNKSSESGYWYMPADENGVTFIDTIINFVTVLVFPISLSLLFPVFLYTIVLEKEEKLIQMMKMNGLKISSYWVVYFVFNLILSIITNLVFVFMGYLLTGMRLFTETSPLLLAFTLLGWALAQIGLAVFFQTFLNDSRSANIIGYLISIWMSMIGSTICIAAYQFPLPFPFGLRMFAPFGFVRILYLMLMGCSDGQCYGSISNLPEQMKHCLIFLYINFIFFFALGAYLFQVIPQEFGVTRSIFFPLKGVAKMFRKKRGMDSSLEVSQDPELQKYIHPREQDQFSKKERSGLLAEEQTHHTCPLVINNLRKLYRKEGREELYPAVKSFNLKVGARETFGLLGPNGAGKTTLISMITGMFAPNYGNAWIGGYDIKTDIAHAQLEMGVCPQFDLLWPQLTVQEHLYFYARLKGIAAKSIDHKVKCSLEEVNLTNFKDMQSSSLSGGMKRRLSVAISLVGDPKIVFLDEPSTGLDPDNRRQLWEVLAKCQKRRSIFITTHMMEEADTLCNRIGIITSGVLRTVGSQTKLKKCYGGGYRVTMSTARAQRKLIDSTSLNQLSQENKIEEYDEGYDAMEDDNLKRSISSFLQVQEEEHNASNRKKTEALCHFMSRNFEGAVLTKQYNGYVMFKVPLSFKASEIFETMQKIEQELEVSDVAITNSSLEDVFMNVVRVFEIEAAKGSDLKESKSQQKGEEASEGVEEWVGDSAGRLADSNLQQQKQ